MELLKLIKRFGFDLSLSKHLQKSDIDLRLATRLADETLEEMEIFRNSAEKIFQQIYTTTLDLAGKFQVEITMP